MRDYKQLEVEISRIRESRITLQKKREISIANKRLNFLSTCAEYIKTNPSLEFVEKEYERLSSRLVSIEKHYPVFESKTAKSEKEKREEFERLNGIKKLREQLRTLRFILN